jgi:hypothetical protein
VQESVVDINTLDGLRHSTDKTFEVLYIALIVLVMQLNDVVPVNPTFMYPILEFNIMLLKLELDDTSTAVSPDTRGVRLPHIVDIVDEL